MTSSKDDEDTSMNEQIDWLHNKLSTVAKLIAEDRHHNRDTIEAYRSDSLCV